MKHILLIAALLASFAFCPLGADAQGVIVKPKPKPNPVVKPDKAKQEDARRRQREAAEHRQREREAAERRQQEREAAERRQREQEEAQRRQQEREVAERRQREQEEAQRRQQEREAAERRQREREEAQRRNPEIYKLANNMVYVQGGTFMMGADASNKDAYKDEKPAHQVTLSSYYICKYEVTQALWQEVMGSNPSNFKGDNLPVENVSWNDCQEFISKLNALTGQHYRLPTEAEWEFAARGGNSSRGYKYSGSSTLSDVAWYDDNSGNTTHPVGTKSPNELGLYDMSGNVWEWCSDWNGNYSSSAQTNPAGPSSGTRRVFRGGCWYNFARFCRASCRNDYSPAGRGHGLGLRLVRS